MKRIFRVLGGSLAGVANGLLGAGSGMVIVLTLRRSGLPVVKSHATSATVILPICVLSAGLYLFRGSVAIGQSLPYLPWMLAGSVIDSWVLPRLNRMLLRRLFGVLMLWAAWRMLLWWNGYGWPWPG